MLIDGRWWCHFYKLVNAEGAYNYHQFLQRLCATSLFVVAETKCHVLEFSYLIAEFLAAKAALDFTLLVRSFVS